MNTDYIHLLDEKILNVIKNRIGQIEKLTLTAEEQQELR